MFRNRQLGKRIREKGNIFFTLFAAVGVVGAIGVGSTTLLKGPVQTMVKINQNQVTEEYSELGLRVMMASVLQDAGMGNGNCDGDNKLEAAPWDTPGAGESAPTGGGVFPSTYGTKITDPWGRRFGYCVWDHGSAIDDAGCGGGTQNRLRGAASDDTQPFITVISSGPNQRFETTCNDYVDVAPADGNPDTALIVKPSTSDDLVINYSMIDAKNAMGDQWVFDSNTDGDADAATTDQNIDLSQDVTIDGVLDLAKLGGGLILPDMATATCNGTTEGQMFRDAASTPPAVMVCQSGSFVAMSGTASAVDYAYDFTPEDPNCTINAGGPLVEVGLIAPTYATSSAIWSDGTYIYGISTTSPNSEFAVYSFNGTTFTQITSLPIGGTQIWGDGTYIYLARRTVGVTAYTFDGATLTEVATHNTPGQVYGVWGDGTYLYLSDGLNGIRAVSFDGTSFTEHDDALVTNRSYFTWSDGNYIYAHDLDNGLKAFSFDGTTLTQVGADAQNIRYVSGHGEHIFTVTDTNHVQALSFDGSTFTLLGSTTGFGTIDHIWHDGTHLYVSSSSAPTTIALSFDGTNFTTEDTFASTWSEGTAGDGKYIYVSHRFDGIRAYSGFECLSTTPSALTRPDSPNTGIDYNYRTYVWGRELNSGLGDGGGAVDTDQLSAVSILNHNELYLARAGELHVSYSGCGLKTDGSAWCWGDNGQGQLGDGTQTNSDVPVAVIDGHKFINIEPSWTQTCALKEDGSVWCWGQNWGGMLGSASAGSPQLTPYQVDTISDFIHLSAGDGTACGLRRNGEAWCWGNNTKGAVGNGSSTGQIYTPQKVQTDLTFSTIDVGEEGTVCALTETGEAWCWGYNSDGQTGIGSAGTDVFTPQKATNIDNFIDISVGSGQTCGLLENGEAWCWGSDSWGALGNGSTLTTTQLSPTKVINIDDFIKITTRATGACGLTSDNKVYCWGYNGSGAVGDGTTSGRDTPVEITAVSNVVDIHCSGETCYATEKFERPLPETQLTAPVIIEQKTTTGNTMDSHGLSVQYDSDTNDHGAGLSFTIDETSNTGTDRYTSFIGAELDSTTGGGGLMFRTHNGASHHEAQLSSSGALVLNSIVESDSPKLGIARNTGNGAWNANRYDLGFLVHQQSSGNPAFYGIDSVTGRATIISGVDLLIQHSSTDGSTLTPVLYMENAGYPRFYGDAIIDERDGGATVTAYTDTADETAALEFFRYRGSEGAPSAVLDEDSLGEILFKGFDGTDYNANSTIRLYSNVANTPSAGDVDTRIVIAKEDGSASGRDAIRIGSGGNTNIGEGSHPATGALRIISRTTADEAVKAGNDTACAVAADVGTVRFTGTHYEYCKDSPYEWVSVVNRTCQDEATFVDISMARYNTCATLSNGQSVCWGENANLQAGNGDTTNPVIELNPIKTMKAKQTVLGHDRHACALTDDNKIKCWGRDGGSRYNLGTGANITANFDHPVFAASNHKYKKITKGSTHGCGIRLNGLVDCWGQNGFGQLGMGDTATRKVPTLNPYLSDIIDISAGLHHTCAVKSDGTAWCWGDNEGGYLGTGNTSEYETTPLKINYDVGFNNFNDIVQISAAGRAEPEPVGGTCAVKKDGTVWCWGGNKWGTIGNGTSSGTVYVTRPTQASGISTAIQVSRQGNSVWALLEDGTVQYWGRGPGNYADSNSPTAATGATNVIKLGDGPNALHMCWILSDGRAQCMGGQGQGLLGNGLTSGNAAAPVDVINPLSCNSDKYVFLTSSGFRGDFGGIDAADAICQAHADRANLPGRYLAWLSTEDTSPADRFNRTLTDYKLVDGTVIANGWYDLTDGTLDNAITIQEDGTNFGDTHVWTATSNDGSYNGADNCNNWTTQNPVILGRKGRSGMTNGTWTDNLVANVCNHTKRLYCFQQ